jgi:hypothetical protein
MARMMPAYCPEDVPPGERALYAALASSPDTDHWIVLHSLGIATHVRQVEGEADFVVIVPNRGVLVIEVKSHQSVERLPDGRWKLGVQSPTNRGPFQQASEAKHSLSNYLSKRGVDLRSVPMLDAVWFTHIRARTMLPATPEWHDWQLLDSEDLRGGADRAVGRVLESGARHLESKIHGLTYGGVGPDQASALRIANVLRPRFEVAAVSADLRRAREQQLVAFIDEQYDALDAMQDHTAVLFTGPAGSGKTLLAQEAARREIAIGGSGRLLCFNRLLGERLRVDAAGLEGLMTRTFHQELRRIVGIPAPTNPTADFWARELPDRAIEVLLESSEEYAADFLVIDELQDLAREPFLDVLDLLVRGGLHGGRLLLFGDFEHQAIYNGPDGRDLLRQRIPRLASHRLTVNCRNLPRIGTVVKRLSHMVPGYSRFRRPDDGADPSFVPYPAGTDQSADLVASVRSLRGEGYDLNEIVVLSPLRGGSTAEATTDPWLRQILRPADGRTARPGELRYATIHAFKGLEAPAIVITDLDITSTPSFESLLYVGMTRATDRLFVLTEQKTLRMAYGGRA